MSKAISLDQLRHLADRCETAKHKRCKCRCGGEFHGVFHPQEWVEEEVERDRLQLARGKQLDWVGYAHVEQHA
jgi:hypothetical protein